MESPFKFLEAYQKNDRDLFFGRNTEIRELYALVAKSNLVVVYGKSGVGKTSLIKCGLINEYDASEMVLIEVRRKHQLLDSLRDQLLSLLNIEPDAAKAFTIPQLVEKIYHRSLKSVFLFFDQFEELFILGDAAEKKEFQETLKAIRVLNLPCVILLVIREEYLSELTDFRKEVKFIFTHMMQIQQMDQEAAIDVVNEIFSKLTDDGRSENITYDPGMTADLVSIVANGKFFIELPYLQVYLDKMFRIADEKEGGQVVINGSLLLAPRISRMETVISNLLTDQIKKAIDRIAGTSETDVINFLKIFVTEQDTKQPVALSRIIEAGAMKNLGVEQIDAWLEIFTNALLLRPLEGNQYELSHDSLAVEIALMRSKTKRTIPVIEGNPYKGLAAFTGEERDVKRFFGRESVINKVVSLLKENSLVIISGASGTGKSSLVKAGILPKLKLQGFTSTITVRPGDYPIKAIESGLRRLDNLKNETTGYVLIIDQYEELITRSRDKRESEAFEKILLDLLINPKALIRSFKPDQQIKVILTIRADMEPQFKIGILQDYWEKGRYAIPYMTTREIEHVIEAPAELAATYFDPPSLIRNMAEEVAGRPSALPLLSFALSLMYEASLPVKLITLQIYTKIGILGALQKKAEDIFGDLNDLDQMAMRHLMLRMVSFSGSEIASRRVMLNELEFKKPAQRSAVKAVLEKLAEDRLIISQQDENEAGYVEPAHDALLLGWPRLWEWINEYNKERMLSRERLWFSISEWKRSIKDEALLWSDNKRFYDFEDLDFERGNWINSEESEFYKESVRIRRNKTRKRYLTYVSLAIAVVSVFITITVIYKRSEDARVTETILLRRADSIQIKRNGELRIRLMADSQLVISRRLTSLLTSKVDSLKIAQANILRERYRALGSAKDAREKSDSLGRVKIKLDHSLADLSKANIKNIAKSDSINALYQSVNTSKRKIDSLYSVLQTLLKAKNDTIKIYDVLANFQERAQPDNQGKTYQTTLAKQTGYRAVWPVDKKLKIGDVGKFSNGTFEVDKNLLDLNIPVTEKQESLNNPDLDGLHGNVKVDNQGDTTIFDFPKNSFLVKSYAPVRHYISNLSAVAANVQKLYNKGKGPWQNDWLIITELIQTDKGIIILADQKGKLLIYNQHKPLQVPEDIPADPVILKQPNGPNIIRHGQLNPYFKVMGLRTDLW